MGLFRAPLTKGAYVWQGNLRRERKEKEKKRIK
jgi:hypothetical protein